MVIKICLNKDIIHKVKELVQSGNKNMYYILFIEHFALLRLIFMHLLSITIHLKIEQFDSRTGEIHYND